MLNYPKKKLALSVTLAICSVTTLSTVAANEKNSEQQSIEEVVVSVSPILDSQKAALQAKKTANNLVDIIAADTIGRFPDQNLADSLGRVPGVAIERDQGQARYINFRGAPFKYSPIAIDGIVIPGAENGRVARFDSFPSVITSRLIANKAITPDMPGDAVAGFINIETHDPFKIEGFSFNADLGLGKQDLGNGDIEKTALKASYSTENWGGMIYTSKNSREQITDNREYDWLAENQLGGVEFRSYEITREDEAFGGKLEYRFNKGLGRVFVSLLESEFNDHELRNQTVFDIQGGMEQFEQNAPTGTENYVPLSLVERWLQDGDYKSATETKTIGFEYNLKGWLLEGRVSATETENSTHLPLLRGVGGTTALSYNVTNLEDPQAELFEVNTTTPLLLQDISYAANVVLNAKSEMDIEATQIKFDVTKDMNLFGLSSEVKFGFNSDSREAEGYGFYMDFSDASLYGFMSTGINPADYDTGVPWDSDFKHGVGGTYYDNETLRADWEAQVGDLGNIDIPAGDLIIIDETVTAFYAMATSHFDWGNVVYGARIEQTDYTSEGPDGTFEDDYINILPSFHVNYNLSEDQKLRWSITTGISRPNYGEWRATTSVIPISSTISAGNPELEAEETIGTDISYEWYIGDASMLSAAAFYRSIDNVIYVNSNDVDGGTVDPSFAGSTWSYTQSVNGEEGRLSGAEVNLIAYASDFLDVMDGFGISMNYTMLDSEFTTLTGEKYSLPGTSDSIYNASVFYEAHGFSARLNYQYRDDWFSTTENASEPEYWAGQERADLALSYALPNDVFGSEVSFYFNANNLTDAVDSRYVGSASTPNQVERYGKRYMAGIRINY